MISKSPILITGCPRSGVDIISEVFQICGAFAGGIQKRSLYSCSNHFKIGALVSEYFDFIGMDNKAQYPLPKTKDVPVITSWRKRIENIINEEGYVKDNWMVQDSRTCLIWPVWNHAYPTAKWILVRRRTGDIVKSCLQTHYMSAFKNKENIKAIGMENEADAWVWWVKQYEKKFVEMIEAGLNCKIIWPERIKDGDYSQVYEVLEWCGLPWKTEIVDKLQPIFGDYSKK